VLLLGSAQGRTARQKGEVAKELALMCLVPALVVIAAMLGTRL
jgi:hypothetical protein